MKNRKTEYLVVTRGQSYVIPCSTASQAKQEIIKLQDLGFKDIYCYRMIPRGGSCYNDRKLPPTERLKKRLNMTSP